MRLLEYEAKSILRTFHIPIPQGTVVSSDATYPLRLPIVIKSQVPIGGRGKAGGIKIASTPDEFAREVTAISSLTIGSYSPRVLLCEEVLSINRELYVSLIINRSTASIELLAHNEGGIEVESHNQAEFYRHTLIDNGFEEVGDSLAEYYDIPSKAPLLRDIVEKAYQCFIASDATLLEINPLILTQQGELISGDCKMTLDDSAAFRHPEWSFEEMPTSNNFVALNPHGTVATIANGAGLAMATVDAVTAAGLIPANFLDIGGGATTEHIVTSFQKIMEFPHVTAIVINIFGGIVRCDIVASAIIQAREQIPHLPPLYIRLSGNKSVEAATVLEENGMKLYATLQECIEEIAR